MIGNLSSIFENRNIESHLFPNNNLNLIFTEIIFLICIICFFIQIHEMTNFQLHPFIHLAISISHVAFDAGYNCYQKYMME